ncbi:MAG TPA: hypothetical protein VKP30_05735, partial [Polyangiaceae bacterium]|nr:hypothetical protein [Polyangiaceae bacterium]
DGNAFDIVYSARGPSNHDLKLVRVGAHGESILPPRTLDSGPAERSSFPGLAWDGERLVVAHGDTPTVSVYDTNGGRVAGPVALLDELPAWTVTMGYQVLATPSRYDVLALGSEGDGAPWDLAGVRLMNVDPSTLARLSAVLFHPHSASREAPSASATLIDGELAAIKAPSSNNLELGRFDPVTLEPKAELRFVFEPPGLLSPVGVHCDAARCYVLAHQSEPSWESSGARTGVWQVERASGRVIAPERGGTALGLPRAVPRLRAGQFVAALGSSELIDSAWADAPRLTIWSSANEWSSYPWPEDSPYEDLEMFVESDALRLFYRDDSVSSPAPGFQRLFANGQYGAPTPISLLGSVQQCGNTYIRQDVATRGSTTRIMRWRPGVDADFVPLVDVPFDDLWGMCCSDSVILAAGSDGSSIGPTTLVYSINGTLLNSYDGGIQQCASRNDTLLVLPNAEKDLKGYRVDPKGTLEPFELTVPDGLLPTRSDLAYGSGPWSFELGEEVLTLAWNDVGRKGTYLSVWRIP